MSIIDAKNLLDELIMMFEDTPNWSIDDWNVGNPQADMKRLKMLSNFAKKRNPSVAGLVRSYINKIDSLVSCIEEDVNRFNEAHKVRHRTDSYHGIEHAIVDALADSIDAVKCFKSSQEELRLCILEFLDLLSLVIS